MKVEVKPDSDDSCDWTVEGLAGSSASQPWRAAAVVKRHRTSVLLGRLQLSKTSLHGDW